jgi:hypothetical protein
LTRLSISSSLAKMTLCGQKCKTEDEDSYNYPMEAKWKLSTPSFLAKAAARKERI